MSASELYATDDTFREVADILFGGGYDEVIAKAKPGRVAKANPDGMDLSARRKRERTQARVGLATNIVGIAAGTTGTAAAVKTFKDTKGKGQHVKPFKGLSSGAKLKRLAIPATVVAGAGLGLQAANLGGDMVANRVLAREAKGPKKKPHIHKRVVQKSIKEIAENASYPKQKLTQASITTAARAGGKGMEYAKKHKLKRVGTSKLPCPPKTVQKRADDLDLKWEGEISKIDSDKQQVFGWASIVEVNGEPVVDLQGDYISIDEVEKAGYEYVKKSRKGGDMHLRDGDQPVHASDMIESFIVTPEKKQAMKLPDETPTGWWVGFQVNDPEVWSKVKSGQRTGFSIHGRGQRSPA